MKLYIANGTRHNIDFLYRLPEAPQPRMTKIPVGNQVMLSGDLNTQQIDAIVNQHAMYGLVAAEDIDHTKPFVGMCYSIDKPVKAVKLLAMDEHNQSLLADESKRNREELAIATHQTMEQNVPGFMSVETSIVEETKSGGAPSIAEGVRVSRRAPQTRRPLVKMN